MKMYSLKIVSVVIAVLLLAGLIQPISAAAQEPAAFTPSQNYTLSFYEDFDGEQLNISEWNYRIGTALGGRNIPKNVRVQDSKLFLDFKYEDYDNDGTSEYTCGGIFTKRSFGYGYYEIKAKLYKDSPGLHQSFWSSGTSSVFDVIKDAAPASNLTTEIDGFEVDSYRTSSVYHGVIDWTAGNNSVYHGDGSDIDTSQWFTCGYEWLPGKVNFYMNGVLKTTVPFNENFQPQNVWLTALAMPDITNRGEVVPPPEGAAMQVEYFKYYSTKVNKTISGNTSFEYQTMAAPSSAPDSTPINQNPCGWIEQGDKDASFVTQADARTGSCALTHNASSAYSVITRENLTNIANGTYDLTAWTKSSGGQSQAVMKAAGYGGTDLSVSIPASDTWTQIKIPDIKVTNQTLSIQLISEASANQWIFIDDVELVDKPALDKSGSILIDNGDSGYIESGTWLDSSIKGYNGSGTRYSTSTANTYARWTPNISDARNYEVYLYKPVHTDSDTNAEISVVSANGTSKQNINFTQGTSGWYYLGTYPFAAGTNGYVQNTASSAYDRTDAVVFVPEDSKPEPTATPVPTPTPVPSTFPIAGQRGNDGSYYYKATKDSFVCNYSYTEYTDAFIGTSQGLSLPAVRYYTGNSLAGLETWFAYRINIPHTARYKVEFYSNYPMTGPADRTFSILNSNEQTLFSNNSALTSAATGWIDLGEADLTQGIGICKLSLTPSSLENGSLLRSDTIRLTPVIPQYSITAVVSGDNANGVISGTGIYETGETVTLHAAVKNDSGYIFSHWEDSKNPGVHVCETPEFVFQAAEDTAYIAVYKQSGTYSVTVINGGDSIPGLGASGNAADIPYGTKATVTASIDPTVTDYVFDYWEANGKIVCKNPVYEFLVTEDITITAQFKPASGTTHTVLFKDINGVILQRQQVEHGTAASAPVNNPSKPGKIFTGWDREFNNVTGDLVITALYQSDNQLRYTVKVNGVVKGEYVFDTKIKVTADADGFSYWKRADGKIMSYQPEYEFFVSGDLSLTAVYHDDTTPKKPSVVIDNNVIIDTSVQKMSFVSQVALPLGYEIIECGTLISVQNNDFTLNSPNILKIKAGTLTPTLQYMVTLTQIPAGKTRYAKGYVVYKDIVNSTISIAYSGPVTAVMGTNLYEGIGTTEEITPN